VVPRKVNDLLCRSRLAFLLFVILTLPFLPILIPVQIGGELVESIVLKRREKKLAGRMKGTERLVSWPDVCGWIDQGEGYLIAESVYLSRPPRFWWTAEDIPGISPYRCYFDEVPDDPALFEDWCRNRYTDPHTGTAKLVHTVDVDTREQYEATDRYDALRRCVHIHRHRD
jgi:hypothetical protein